MRIKVGKQGTVKGGDIMSGAIKRTPYVQVVKMPKISASETSTLEDHNKILGIDLRLEDLRCRPQPLTQAFTLKGAIKKCVRSLERLTSTITHIDFTSTIIRRRENHV
jgi:hypothetical protein